MRNQITRLQPAWMNTFLNDDALARFSYGSNIDIYKDGTNYVVVADLPGFDREDIDIDFKGDLLTLRAERNEESEDTSDKNYYYRTRSSRSMNKQIRFADVDVKNIDASYENGVLKVILPVLSEDAENTRKIEVK